MLTKLCGCCNFGTMMSHHPIRLALEKNGPSIVLDELEMLQLPAGVLYLSHDEQRLHEHRHEDEELHMYERSISVNLRGQ